MCVRISLDYFFYLILGAKTNLSELVHIRKELGPLTNSLLVAQVKSASLLTQEGHGVACSGSYSSRRRVRNPKQLAPWYPEFDVARKNCAFCPVLSNTKNIYYERDTYQSTLKHGDDWQGLSRWSCSNPWGGGRKQIEVGVGGHRPLKVFEICLDKSERKAIALSFLHFA